MKRKFLSLFLCAALLISGCTANENSALEVGDETSSQTASSVETTVVIEERQKETTLKSVSMIQLKDASLNFNNDFLNQYMKASSGRLGDYEFSRDDEWKLSLNGVLKVRMSTRRIAVSDKEKASFTEKVNNSPYITLEEAEENSSYSYFKENAEELSVKKVNYDGTDVAIDISNIKCGYHLSDTITLNAFVSQNKDGVISFIPDPEYMHGIPVIANNPEYMTFDINGNEIMLDSFNITCSDSAAKDFPKVFEERGTDFFYAKISFDGFDLYYDFDEGYKCSTCHVNQITPVTDDIDTMLNKTFAMDDFNKDPEMSETYNVIMDNIDTIYDDYTHGLTLLDMDFDGKPELLVSDVFQREEDINNPVGVNVSVYRIEKEGLKYISTFPSSHRVVYSVYNSLGLKTLSDGTRGWFSTSYNDEDFIYQLKGDQLTATQIFCKEKNDEYVDENGYTITEYDYYFMEELIVPNVIHEDITGIEGPASDTHYEWNEYYSYWGNMWELVGKIREGYCSDITETYCLYNDWLSPYTNNNASIYTFSKHYALSEREISFNIAYMVDSFYLGEYNPASYSYEYRFLGDYAKPVIYLYPEEETNVSIRVELPENGELTCTYPEYGYGWNVTALPDGTIYDKDGNEYYCLYWEGNGSIMLEGGRGWCVEGKKSAEFLREKLLEIGLTAREANEFIIYWLPELQKNPYNVITLHTDDYARGIPLSVSPEPDSVIRVFMTFKASEEFVEIEPQMLPHYERNGFTLVEWGGSWCE